MVHRRDLIVLVLLSGPLLAQSDSALFQDPRVQRILRLESKGRHQATSEAYDELAADTAFRSLALRRKGTCLALHQGRAVEVQPDSPYALNNLGYAELRAGDREAALRLVQRSIEIDPGNSYAYRNLGHVWKEMGDLAKACEAYERALQLGFGMRYGPEVKQMKDTYCR